MPSDKTICCTLLPMYKYGYNRIPLIWGLFIFASLVAYSIWSFKRKLIYFSHYTWYQTWVFHTKKLLWFSKNNWDLAQTPQIKGSGPQDYPYFRYQLRVVGAQVACSFVWLDCKSRWGGWETPAISSGLIIAVVVHRTQGSMFANLF